MAMTKGKKSPEWPRNSYYLENQMNINSCSFLPSVLLNFIKCHLRFVYMEKKHKVTAAQLGQSFQIKQNKHCSHSMHVKPALTYLWKIVRPNYEHRKRTEYTTADFASCKNSINIVCMEIFKWIYLTEIIITFHKILP